MDLSFLAVAIIVLWINSLPADTAPGPGVPVKVQLDSHPSGLLRI